jgi:acetylornithine deacetylase
MTADRVDVAIGALAEHAFGLLERLVAEPSTIGQEAGAQEVLAEELQSLRFDVTRLEIPESIAEDPAAGVSRNPYAGRYDVIGRRPSAGGGPSLLLNGHMDVVPAEDLSQWTSRPFEPIRRDGWLVGRGAGDMKGGFAAGLLALRALDDTVPGWQRGDLTFVSAIEEEATGNGTLAAGRAGYLADAALLLEPTDLDILLGGIALIWVRVELTGRAGHAEAALHSVNPVRGISSILQALESIEQQLNAEHARGEFADDAFSAIPHPYNVNVGKVHAGDWASSVPSTAWLEVRVGHPRRLASEDAFDLVRSAVLAVTSADPWFSVHPPTVSMSGYRAQRYFQDPDADVVTVLARAHESAHGNLPEQVTIGSTTDARFYLNQFGVPAIAYGPRTRNMHGTDEAVELASIVDCARTLARFLLDWYGTGRTE